MSRFSGELSKVLKEYNDTFEVYYCNDYEFASLFFNTTQLPQMVPNFYIVEPSNRVKIEKRDGTAAAKDSYATKHVGFAFKISEPGSEFKEFIDKYLDEKWKHHYVTEDRVTKTLVKTINS